LNCFVAVDTQTQNIFYKVSPHRKNLKNQVLKIKMERKLIMTEQLILVAKERSDLGILVPEKKFFPIFQNGLSG
jgi:hypothetical protein